MCNVDDIIIKDPETGSVQCQDCLKCTAGEGLSVDCGDVITPNTPLVCKPCVLGETYSSAYEAGACKDCENCGEYRETKKACTLTSKAECGKCKPGAYEEPMLGMCKPCSPCCNDGKDIVVPECQLPGVPANMQCSYARSEKCSKVANTSASTTGPPLQTTKPIPIPPELATVPPSVATVPVPLKPTGKQVVSQANSSLPNGVIIGAAIGGFALLILVLVLLACYFKTKRRKVRKDENDVEMQSNAEANESDESETDEPNAEDALLEDNKDARLGVEETLDSPLPTGTQDTQPPEPHSSTGKLIFVFVFKFIHLFVRSFFVYLLIVCLFI